MPGGPAWGSARRVAGVALGGRPGPAGSRSPQPAPQAQLAAVRASFGAKIESRRVSCWISTKVTPRVPFYTERGPKPRGTGRGASLGGGPFGAFCGSRHVAFDLDKSNAESAVLHPKGRHPKGKWSRASPSDDRRPARRRFAKTPASAANGAGRGTSRTGCTRRRQRVPSWG